MFQIVKGPALLGYILGVFAVSALIFFALTQIPGRARKPLIAAVTFLAGLFFALEFFWPVNETSGQNFLTPFVEPISQMSTVLQAFALGLGVYSLLNLHLRSIARQRTGWGFSVVLIAAIFALAVPSLLNEYHPNRYNAAVKALFYNGGLNSLDAAMFSIIAFYIVSAAYRAFRIRSTEATILLASAFIVMLGQVAIGQAITSAIPNQGFAANFRVENIANWILTKVNSPAVLAVDFGLGIGSLALSLRLWLSLERGSYFEKEL